jgi:glycosyltransferase involved in cell wall biosynthesis
MKKKVLFVGSFLTTDKNGGFGGQMYACQTLLSSELADDFEWLKVDTTAPNNLHISLVNKLPRAIRRLVSFMFLLFYCKPDFVFIFTSNGYSFLEKGIMSIISKRFSNATVILAPRSGRLKDELISRFPSLGKVVFGSCDIILCQGKNWENFYKKIYPDLGCKLIVLKNWIDTDSYPFSIKQNGKIIILFMAWLEKAKGIFDLLDAVNKLSDKTLQNIQIHIAGKGKDEQEILRIIDKQKWAKQVVMHGWIFGEKKSQVLQSADIFVLPSYFEGMPNALLECMCSGIACIASNVGAVDEVINDRINGMIISPGNIEELSNSIEYLVVNSEQRLSFGLKAREYILQEHSLSRVVKVFRESIFVE